MFKYELVFDVSFQVKVEAYGADADDAFDRHSSEVDTFIETQLAESDFNWVPASLDIDYVEWNDAGPDPSDLARDHRDDQHEGRAPEGT